MMWEVFACAGIEDKMLTSFFFQKRFTSANHRMKLNLDNVEFDFNLK